MSPEFGFKMEEKFKPPDIFETIDFQFRQILEDDFDIKTITPMEEIIERLVNLFSAEEVAKWHEKRFPPKKTEGVKL